VVQVIYSLATIVYAYAMLLKVAIPKEVAVRLKQGQYVPQDLSVTQIIMLTQLVAPVLPLVSTFVASKRTCEGSRESCVY